VGGGVVCGGVGLAAAVQQLSRSRESLDISDQPTHCCTRIFLRSSNTSKHTSNQATQIAIFIPRAARSLQNRSQPPQHSSATCEHQLLIRRRGDHGYPCLASRAAAPARPSMSSERARSALRPVQQQMASEAAADAPPAKKTKLSAPVAPELYKCAASDAFTW